MPLPELSDHGVLPSGCHRCTLDDVEARFVNNRRRRELWDLLEEFLNWVSQEGAPDAVILDGSFATDKEHPKDIDVVLDLSTCADPVRRFWLDQYFTRKEEIDQRYQIDFYVYHPGAGNDLRLFFEYVRTADALARGMNAGDRKGTMRIDF